MEMPLILAWVELLGSAALIAIAWFLHAAFVPSTTAASDPIPHAFGVLGMLLMLWAEVAHSARRSLSDRATIPASISMGLHVVAGLVGPALVLMHTGWRWRGLPGAVTWMTLAVVASGAVGRFVYPAVGGKPASPARRAIASWHLVHVPLAAATIALAALHVAAALYYAAGLR